MRLKNRCFNNQFPFIFLLLFCYLLLYYFPIKAYAVEDAPTVGSASAVNFTQAQANYLGGTALDDQGAVWAWGYNTSGQIGIQDINGKIPIKLYAGGMFRVPYFIENNIKIESITGGDHTNYAVDKQGVVYAWGRGLEGQMGNGSNPSTNNRPSVVTSLSGKKIIQVFTSSEAASFTYALDDQNKLYAFGYGANDVIQGKTGYVKEAVELTDFKNTVGVISDISLGNDHGVILNDQGEIFTFGNNTYGQRGNGKTGIGAKDPSIEKVSWFSDRDIKIKRISSNTGVNLVLTEDNEVYQWGHVYEKAAPSVIKTPQLVQYDLSTSEYEPTPEKITAGKFVSYFIDTHGRLWSWGYNTFYSFGTDGPLPSKLNTYSATAKRQPKTLGDGDTQGGLTTVKTPVFKGQKHVDFTSALLSYKTHGQWSAMADGLHPTIYDKKYMKTVGEFGEKNEHNKVFPIDGEGNRLVYTVREVAPTIYDANFLIATDSYTGDWIVELKLKDNLPVGLTNKSGIPAIKESEKSWIGLSTNLETFDYSEEHPLNEMPYIEDVYTYQSSTMVIDNSGNMYRTALDGSAAVAWGWDYSEYESRTAGNSSQDGLYNMYMYEFMFMRGAPRQITGSIEINSKKEKRYISDNESEQINMKIDIGTAYHDEQLNIKVEPELKQVKMVKMPYDANSNEFTILEPTYDQFMDAYNNASQKGFETVDIAQANGWEGIKHSIGDPPIETLVDDSIEVSDNSVVWIMLETQGYSNFVTTTKRIVYDNFYTDQEVTSSGALLKNEDETYTPRKDNVSKVNEDKHPNKLGYPLDANKKVISEPSFGYDEVSVKRISDSELDKDGTVPKFSHRYLWANGQSEEKIYTLGNGDTQNNGPGDIAETHGMMPYDLSNKRNHKFYYEENPDLYFNLHYVGLDKDGKKLTTEEFSIPTETLVMKEVELVRTAPEHKVNEKLIPTLYQVDHHGPSDTIDLSTFEKLPKNYTLKFTVPYDPAIKDVTIYYVYEEDERDVTLNIRQVIQEDSSSIKIPKTGYMTYQRSNDKWEKQNGINQVKVPSDVEKKEVDYKTIKTKVKKENNRFVLSHKTPQYYEYVGFKQSNTKDENNKASLKTEKEVKVDYSDDSNEKWVTVYLKPTTDSPLNYSWETITNKFGKLLVPQNQTVKVKFYSDKNDTSVPAKLMDFVKDENGLLAEGHPNIADYYFKMDMLDGSGTKKLNQGELIPDISLKEEKNLDTLPETIPIKVYYTNSSGNEEESFAFGQNGIMGKRLAAMNFKATKTHTEVNKNNNETIVWYYYDCEFASGS